MMGIRFVGIVSGRLPATTKRRTNGITFWPLGNPAQPAPYGTVSARRGDMHTGYYGKQPKDTGGEVRRAILYISLILIIFYIGWEVCK